MASCGYDAFTVNRTDQKMKKLIHQYAYLFEGIKNFNTYQPNEIEVNIDYGAIVETAAFVVISNVHFYGGSWQITPFARIDDGLLDVCLFQGRSQSGLIQFIFNMVFRNHLKMHDVKYYQAKSIELAADQKSLVQVDGDILGKLPMKAKVTPRAIRLFT